MIVGIGVDLVDIPRFERSLSRTPGLLTRLFASSERGLRGPSLAARYAAKEALIKALGGSDGVHWTEIEVARASGAAPRFSLSGSTAAVVAARGITALHLSLSHDAGLAAAYVVAESGAPFGSAFGDLEREEPRPRTVGFSARTDGGMGDALISQIHADVAESGPTGPQINGFSEERGRGRGSAGGQRRTDTDAGGAA